MTASCAARTEHEDCARLAGFGSVHRHGIGPTARRTAMGEADELRAGGSAARALFRADLGGWVVIVYGPLHRR